LTAPVSTASADISAKIVVPKPASPDRRDGDVVVVGREVVVGRGAVVVGRAVVGGAGGAGVEAPTGRQIERPGISSVSVDASFTASRSDSDTSAASAIRIQ
jgi:hypothetical protein